MIDYRRKIMLIKKAEIQEIQKKWADGIVKIGSLKGNLDLCKEYTHKFIDQLYAFAEGPVLFKPTKAARVQFRANKEAALSYFIGGNPNYEEDKGFAITPWKEVRFADDARMILEEDRALVMGNYFFTDYDNNEVMVEYSFSYKKYAGQLKIDLHHSSLPFKN